MYFQIYDSWIFISNRVLSSLLLKAQFFNTSVSRRFPIAHSSVLVTASWLICAWPYLQLLKMTYYLSWSLLGTSPYFFFPVPPLSTLIYQLIRYLILFPTQSRSLSNIHLVIISPCTKSSVKKISWACIRHGFFTSDSLQSMKPSKKHQI